MPELKLYTVAHIRDWLMHNRPTEGLTAAIIAPTRAWAIIHNPYVTDEDVIVAGIFEEHELAAFAASFPDEYYNKRIWWFTTLFCYPQFSGRGYGMIVFGALKEAHEPEFTLDRWGAQETVAICRKLGLETLYSTRYILSDGNIDTTDAIGKLAYLMQQFKKKLHPYRIPKMSESFRYQYASYVDEETYEFMRAHRGGDLFFRTKEVLNWIMTYSHVIGGDVLNKVDIKNEFSSVVSLYSVKIVKVYQENSLIGVFMMRKNTDAVAIVQLYYDDYKRDAFFSAISEHIYFIRPNTFMTEDADLIKYIRNHFYFPKYHEIPISFSFPPEMSLSNDFSLQLGDGDGFI